MIDNIKIIDGTHPTAITSVFSNKKLTRKQQRVLDMLPSYGARVIVKKRDVSMLDLAAFTAVTGDEFAMFTRGSRRLIVRGNRQRIPLNLEKLKALKNAGYRWSGHTHPGTAQVHLTISDGDRKALAIFKQHRSAVYNAMGRYAFVTPLKSEES